MLKEINHDHSSSSLDYVKRYYYSTVTITTIQENETITLLFYPNPTTDFLNINANISNNRTLIEMFDMTGRQVLNKYIENNTIIPVNDFQKGLYLVRISEGNKIVHTEKIQIQ